MEPIDFEVLGNPEKHILSKGGSILMAYSNKEIAGTVALKFVAPGVYEFTKMAVDENFRRKGIAEKLCYASLHKAKELGATTVILYSNTKNAAAIKLYEKIGFRHLKVEPGVYKRANVKMEIGIEEADMVRGMTRSVRHVEIPPARRYPLLSMQHDQRLLRHREHLAP